MQHIIKCDAPELIPFARNCIRRLQATGLEYGSQKFDVGGITVRVEINPGVEYIWIEGGDGPSSAMDSGLVAMHSIDPEDAISFTHGNLWEVGKALTYNSPYSVASTGRWAGWRTNDTTDSGQMAGALTSEASGRFAGHLRTDGAAADSFRPLLESVTAGDGTVTHEETTDDAALLAKKTLAVTCPASVFTGRLRLYIQALYGARLYQYSDPQSETSQSPNPDPAFPLTGGPLSASGPTLKLTAYHRADDPEVYDPITINTSTGLYFDPVSAKHFLRNIEDDRTMSSYPLVSSVKGEALRKILKLGVSRFVSADDLENLEALILSESLPDVQNRAIIGSEIVTVDLAWARGYGWHWNWSGTAADIVTAEPYDQDGINSGMESYHYRITTTAASTSEAGVTTDGSASSATLSGPERWTASRVYWCIAEPDWATGLLVKSTPEATIQTAGGGPFYAFYVRDDLKLCRIDTEYVPGGVVSRTVNPPEFAGPDYGDAIIGSTLADQGGSCEDFEPANAHYTTTITCGTYSVSGLLTSRSVSSVKYEVLEKVAVTEDPGYPLTNWNVYFTPCYILVGYPPYETETIPIARLCNTQNMRQWTWKYDTSDLQDARYSQAAVAVPMYDSEAIFMWSRKTHQTSSSTDRSSRASYRDDGGVYDGVPWDIWTWFRPVDFDHPIEYRKRYGWDTVGVYGGYVTSSETITVPLHVESHETAKKLISHGGVTDVENFPGVPIDDSFNGSFFANELETIPYSFETYSGTSAVNPVVIALGRITTIGGTEGVDTDTERNFDTEPFALVGWV